MRNPFEREKKQEIGLDMTPGYVAIRNGSGKLPDFLGLESKKGGGGGGRVRRPKIARPSSETYEASGPKKVVLPRTGGAKKESPKYTKVSAPKGSSRRCIVKVDMRSYSDTTAGGQKGNQRYVSARLAPFIRPDKGNTWAKVSYIGREEAIDGRLFSTDECGRLIGWDGDSATKAFGSDPTLTIILSPEDKGADLVELTRRFMEEIYRSNAEEAPRLWVAGIHGNTNHKHVHILVSCRGISGGNARVSKSSIYNLRLKSGAERILTEIQGVRGWAEEAEAIRRERNRMRLTREDTAMFRAIRARMRDDKKKGKEPRPGLLVLGDIKEPESKNKKGGGGDSNGDKKLKASCSRRLQELKTLGLVSKEGCGHGEWQFVPDAEERLRKAEFEEAFGLTPEDMAQMKLDGPLDPAYGGEILEYVELRDGRTMLFLIRNSVTGVIHMHRETVSEDRKTRLESVESVSLDKVKGVLSITGALQDRG